MLELNKMLFIWVYTNNTQNTQNNLYGIWYIIYSYSKVYSVNLLRLICQRNISPIIFVSGNFNTKSLSDVIYAKLIF